MNPGFLTIYPTSDSSAPVASDINWTNQMIVPNFTYLPTDGTGEFDAFNNPGGAVNLIADVFGYFTPVTVSNAVEVVADPASVAANGSTSQLTITVLHNGNTVANDAVDLSVSPSSCGTISSTSVTTGSNGAAIATYTASTTVENCTITALEAQYGQTGSVTISQTSPKNSIAVSVVTQSGTGASVSDAITTDPTQTAQVLPVGEYSSSLTPSANTDQISATVSNSSGPVGSDTVTFTLTPTTSGACGTLSAATATTNSSGVATTEYTPSSTVGFCQVSVSESATGGSTSVYLDQTAVPAVTVTAKPTDPATSSGAPEDVNATGSATQSFTVTYSSSSALSGDPVLYLLQNNNASCGTLSASTGSLDANGQTSVTYTSSTVIGNCDVNVVEGDMGLAQTIYISQTPAYALAITANPTSLMIGSGDTSTVTVNVTENGAEVSGAPVVVTESGTCGNTFGGTYYTNPSGVASFTVSALAAGGTPSFCNVSAAASSATGSVTIANTSA
jgi:hypothetical protein